MTGVMLFLNFLAFFAFLFYFKFSTPLLVKLKAAHLHIQTFPIRPDVVEVVTEVLDVQIVSLVMVDDSPPAYEDLVDEEVKEGVEDRGLPSYEVACENEKGEN